MFQRFTPASSNDRRFFLIVSLVLACAMSAAAAAEELLSRSPERGGIGLDLQQLQFDEDFNPNALAASHYEKTSTNWTSGYPSLSPIKLPHRPSRSRKSCRSWLTICVSTSSHLFRRWWDTANKAPGEHIGRRPQVFCNSETNYVAAPQSQINGFPYQCPRAEGGQAILDPFDYEASRNRKDIPRSPSVNRFDLADKDSGQHCGEFRIVFARNSGFSKQAHRDRNLIIFEALVPNPSPPIAPVKPTPKNLFVNLDGCRPIVEFWLNLSEPR